MKKYFILMLITLMLLTVQIVKSKELNNKLVGKVIVIDAGHGGKDGGTAVDGVYEKDINLQIAMRLKDKLIKHGVDVLVTRDGDYDLSKPSAIRRKKSDFDNRIKLINNSKADMYLSIHMNYLGDSRYYGAQVFYNGDNKILAESIQRSLKKYVNSPMDIKELDDSIYMYKQLTIPGVLIECGFLSNQNERYLLRREKYQNSLVDAIVKGIINYY